jgi:hypothetical protein
MPAGRRNIVQHGGNTLIITEYGLIAISDLVAGKLHSTQLEGSFGYKINPSLSRYVSDLITHQYWFLDVYPVEELLVLGAPIRDTTRGYRQSYCMDSLSNAWFTVSDMDMLCSDTFNGQFIYGTRDGNVIQGFTGFKDGVNSDPNYPLSGTEPTGRLQGAFHAYEVNTMNKRMLRVKMYGFCDGPPSIKVMFKSEYDLQNLLTVPSSQLVQIPVWDQAVWDKDIWDAGVGSFHRWIGVNGFGKMLSLQMAVRGQGRALFTDVEVLYEIGYNL